jgi:hypothetical protein
VLADAAVVVGSLGWMYLLRELPAGSTALVVAELALTEKE